MLASFFMWGVSLTHPMLASFLCGSFPYTPRAVLIFMQGVSLTLPVLFFFWGGGSFCFVCLSFLYEIYSIWRVSVTHPVLS